VVATSLSTVLALNRTVGIVLISVLFFGLGEQLWSPFLPAYLEAKTSTPGASSTVGVTLAALLAVGVYACLRNLFEAACFIGGGELTARLGDRGSLILFGLLTIGGYSLFLTSTSPVIAVVAALLILGWEPLSVARHVHGGWRDGDEDEPGNGLRTAVDPEATAAHHRSRRRRSRAGRCRTTPRPRRRRIHQRDAVARGRGVLTCRWLARHADTLDAGPACAAAGCRGTGRRDRV
jgi:hypothetical protein